MNNFPLAQFYQIYADNWEPFYYIGGGLQDNGSWYGPSRSRESQGIMNREWKTFSGGDGCFVVVHPDNPELFLSEYQGGGIMKTDTRFREQIDASPQPRRNDGGPVEELRHRFNWNSPIVPSPHDPDTGGPIWVENTTAEYHCTIISFAESPVRAGVIWAGSDDATPIQTITPEILDKSVHLFDLRPGLRFSSRDTVWGFGEKPYRAPNPPYGALITYYLKEKSEDDAPIKIEILKDADVVKEIKKAPKEAGLNELNGKLREAGYPEVSPPVLPPQT